MRPKVRPFVKSITHMEGCARRNCGPACVRVVDGWEYHIRQMLPTGVLFEERKKSPLSGKAATQRYADERAQQVMLQSVAPVSAVKKDVPLFGAFEKEAQAYSKTNNKPSTVYAKEWMLRIHLLPFFGNMRLDQIGPADVEAYKAKKLDEGCETKTINNHLTTLRKLLNLAVEWDVVDKAAKVKAFRDDDPSPTTVPHLRGDRTLRPGRRARVEGVRSSRR